ncbi:MAG: hypothetical protein HQL45_17530 [Alphaproteobacteria bacterium]|nr:hypothetical protein [Alphaproteobacteria bacterium]
MDALEVQEIIDTAIKKYKGNVDVLEGAIGAFMFGRHVGWRPLFLIHHRSTVQRYEKVLGVSFREVLPEVGQLAHRCLAWKLAQKIKNFWKAVRGEEPGVKTPMFEGG